MSQIPMTSTSTSSAIIPVSRGHYRKIAQRNWGLTNEQMKGMHVHHRIPVSEGGTNDPANLYVCSPWFHSYVWHGNDSYRPMIEWCSTNGSKGGIKRAKQRYSCSDETRQKMSGTRKGRKHSKQHAKAISKAKKGKIPIFTEESRERWLNGLRKPKGPQPKVTCPYCGKIGGRNALTRFHFDNCKHKPN